MKLWIYQRNGDREVTIGYSLGRLTRHIDAGQAENRIEYDSSGQVREVTAANEARTTYTYDGLGQLLQLHSPDTGTRIHHYDQAGQRIRSHGPDQLDQPEQGIRYHYDALGRLTHIQYPDPQDDIRYHYDGTGAEHGAGIGRLTRIEDRHSRIDYRYDRQGNLLSDSRTLSIDGQTHVQRTEYRYTSGNQLAGITYPNGQRIDYQHKNGQPQAITLQDNKQKQPLVSDIQHRPFGPIQQWTNGNGLTQRINHDLDGRTTDIVVSNHQQHAIWQQYYQYDRLDNITGIERSEGEKLYQQQFGYDLVQRLIRDQGPYGEQQFEYDSVGNRLSQTKTTATHDDPEREEYHYVPASNRLLGTSDKTLLLDPAGNILQESNDTQRDYRYNAQNRISEYYEEGQLKARYHYNSLGQRIHKAVTQAGGSEQHTLFHYGQQGELLGETRLQDVNENSHTQNIVWLQMRPVVALDSAVNNTSSQTAIHISWLHSDHLLTARAATDADQNLIWRWHSDAFGVGEAQSLAQAGQQKLTLNLRFPGQYYDEESGLHYNYFRTYDPQQGRYTQSDPIGLMGGINTFGYAEANSIFNVDIYGLSVICLTAEESIMVFNFIYPKHPRLPDTHNLTPDMISLAGVILHTASEIDSVTDIVSYLGPGALVRPSVGAIARRIAKGEIIDLLRPMSFEEKLIDLSAAARLGAAIKHANDFEMVLNGFKYE